MNLDEAVDLVMSLLLRMQNPEICLFKKLMLVQIGVLGMAVQKLFGDTGVKIIGARHGEKEIV